KRQVKHRLAIRRAGLPVAAGHRELVQVGEQRQHTAIWLFECSHRLSVVFTLSRTMSTDAVVIWGELLWDRYPTEPGGDQPGGDQLGGAPATVSWHLGQAGGWARLVTRVGDDADGHRAIAQLDDLVDTSLIQID